MSSSRFPLGIPRALAFSRVRPTLSADRSFDFIQFRHSLAHSCLCGLLTRRQPRDIQLSLWRQLKMRMIPISLHTDRPTGTDRHKDTIVNTETHRFFCVSITHWAGELRPRWGLCCGNANFTSRISHVWLFKSFSSYHIAWPFSYLLCHPSSVY